MSHNVTFEQQYAISRKIWYALAALSLFTLSWLAILDVSIDVSHAVFFFAVCAVCLAISLVYRHVRRDHRLCLLGHITNQLLCATAALGILSYVSASLNLPLLDDYLIKGDAMFGFDWRDYIAWVDQHPWVARVFTVAYLSSGPQILIVTMILFIYARTAHMQRFLISFITTAFITIILAALFPAVAAYVHYNIDVMKFETLQPAASRIHEQPLLDMRHHVTKILGFPLRGIVTFPSFHAALAVLMIYASLPIRWLFWVAIVVNSVVILATPVDGGHWLTDVLAGMVIAAATAYCVERIMGPGRSLKATREATKRTPADQQPSGLPKQTPSRSKRDR